MFAQIMTLIVLVIIIGVIGLIAWKGKDLLKLQVLQNSIFKQISFLLSPQQNAQKNFHIDEIGNASMPLRPVRTGYESNDDLKKTWLVLHALKYEVYVNGKPTGEKVLITDDRHYLPQDPNKRLTSNAKEKLASLDDIAYLKFLEVLSNAGKRKDMIDLLNNAILGSFILDGIFGVVYLIRIRTGS
jgi:hypothetical protein